MELIAAGLSFRTAPLDVRERAAVGEARARTTLRFLVGHSGLSEAAVLSTCNRTEFYLVAPRPGMSEEVAERLARYLDPGGRSGVGEHLSTRVGAEALAHMFRVAGGLDSMVLGEAQILGQFKAAHRVAREAGTVDAALDFAMKRAISVAKRVRTETRLGRGVASVGELVARWGNDALAGLAERGVLLVGAGQVSGLVARRLARGGARLYVTSLGGASAERLAAEVGGVAVPLDRIDEVVAGVDMVVCSTSNPGPVLGVADIARLQTLRHHRALALVDIAVPRDVEPDAGLLPGVVLTDLDALGSQLGAALAGRRDQLPAAEAIIDEEVPPTLALLAERNTTAPTIAALVARAEELRRGELERTLPRLAALDEEGRSAIDVLTRSLVRKLLHAPIAHLKEQGDDPATALLLREAFALDEPAGPATGAAPGRGRSAARGRPRPG